MSRAYVLVVPGDPVPWQAAVKMGNAPNAPRKMPGRQEHHAGKIRTTWKEEGEAALWLEKGRPVKVECLFRVCRPKSHFGTGRNERALKPQFRDSRPTGRPDLSNLVKMVEDSLTGAIWADDDQITVLGAKKDYIPWWEPPCSEIRIVVL